MSRESHELSEEAWWADEFGKGPSDPDILGYYPGEQEATDVS